MTKALAKGISKAFKAGFAALAKRIEKRLEKKGHFRGLDFSYFHTLTDNLHHQNGRTFPPFHFTPQRRKPRRRRRPKYQDKMINRKGVTKNERRSKRPVS